MDVPWKLWKFIVCSLLISGAVGFGFYFGGYLAQIFLALLPDVEISFG